MTGQSGGETGREAGIGARLRSAREREGLSIEQAAQRLHVEAAILQALESEEFRSVGAPIYVKGYLGRYAELLGESPEALQQLLSSAATIPEPDLTRIPHVRAESRRGVSPAAIVIVLVVSLVVAGSLWWALSRLHRRVALHPPEPFASAAGTHAAALPASLPQSSPPVEPTQRSLASTVAEHSQGKARTGVQAAVPANIVRVTLSFSTPSWVEVDDSTGRHLYRALAAAASKHVFQGVAPLHVVLGYAPGVALTVNGHARPITSLVQSDHAASFVITADGRVLSGPRAAGE